MPEALDPQTPATRANDLVERNRDVLEAHARRHRARRVEDCLEKARAAVLRRILKEAEATDEELRGLAKQAVHDEAVDQVREAVRRERLEQAIGAEIAPSVRTPEEELERAELTSAVNTVLETLTPEQRVLVPHITDGGGYADPSKLGVTREGLPYAVKKVRAILLGEDLIVTRKVAGIFEIRRALRAA